MDDFFTKSKCDRCGGSLKDGRIMSMFNSECLCIACKKRGMKDPHYKEAQKNELERLKQLKNNKKKSG